MLSMKPSNNNFKNHTHENQDLMPMKEQLYFGRGKTPGYKNISRERRQGEYTQFNGCMQRDQ